MTTKRDIIENALIEIGIASYNYDLSFDELNSCLNILDNMVSRWGMEGIFLAYPLHLNKEDSTLDEVIKTPASFYDAMEMNLAIRLCPQFGKTPSPKTVRAAMDSKNSLLEDSQSILTMPLNPMAVPSGAGNQYFFQGGMDGYNNMMLPYPTPFILLANNSILDVY